MKPLIEAIGRRALFALEPELAHRASIAALKTGIAACRPPAPDPRFRVRVAGIDFPNPLGMAAGFDKNAEVPDQLLRLGFGFVEVGTLTPRPQNGNPRPRVFRLEADRAVVNRLGFNNDGHKAALARLSARRAGGIVGVNIGANRDSPDRIADYAAGVAAFASRASYLAVNISSPNTPGLRDLQARDSLAELLEAVMAARARTGVEVPVFLKVAPDLSDAEMEDVAGEALRAGISGLIVSNTTISRDGLTDRKAAETGGVSGRPLFERSTIVLARMRRLVGPAMAIVGVGGVESAQTAIEKIRAGADLVQLYTGLIYGGPGLAGDIVSGMSRILDAEGAEHVSMLRDTRLDHWADPPAY